MPTPAADIAIKTEHIKKSFRLPHERVDSIKSIFLNPFRLRQRAEKQIALEDINIEVKKGEFFGIIGRNGSGKSTLLKILAKIYVPDSGNLTINGKLTPFIELGVGFNPELTGKENVYLNGALLGFTRKQVKSMYKDIVEFAELERFMDQKLKNYSSGMQVRLAFSVAIRAKSDIMLIDEVLAVGDSQFQEKCFNYFKEIKGKKTVVLVSHDMKSIERFCDNVLIIEKSKQLGVGNAQDMVFKYRTIMANDSEDYKVNEIKEGEGVHFGNQDVRIEKISLMQNGKSVSKIKQGGDIALKLHINHNNTVKNPSVNVSIFSGDDNRKILSANTLKQDVKISSISKDGEIIVRWDNNPLAPGKYRVNAAIYTNNNQTPVDHFRDALNFTVPGKNWGNFLVEIPSTWDITIE